MERWSLRPVDVGRYGPLQAEPSLPSWSPSWLTDFLSGQSWPAKTLQAVLVLLLAYFVSRLLVELFGRRIAQKFRRPSVTRMILRGIRAGVFLFAFLTVLSIYGLELGDIAISVAVFSAVLGVVLAPIVSSFVSGMFLLADQPYEIGDMIELVDRNQRGFVEDITLRYTKVFTLDNTFLVIPNGTMRERDVVNYSAEDTRTRQSLDVVVTYESDVERARQVIENAARRADLVVEGGPRIRVGAARYPAAPTCYIDEYGDHGVHLRLRYWIEKPYWQLRVRSEIQTTLWNALEDEDVEIAYPHRHHVFDETSGRLDVAVGDGDADARAEGGRRDARMAGDSDGGPDGAGGDGGAGPVSGDGPDSP